MTAVYFSIANADYYTQSKRSDIKLALLCKREIITKFSYNSVLSHLITDLENMDKNGISIDETHYPVKLVSIVGDNLGLHDLLGLQSSFRYLKYFI